MEKQDQNNYLVDIIVLNYNNWQDTIVCLESLFGLNFKRFRIIMVDNGSSDNSCEQISRWAKGEIKAESPSFYQLPETEKPINYCRLNESSTDIHSEQLIIISNTNNYGYAAGNNIGIRYSLRSNTPYLWILNNDTIATRECLTELIKYYVETPKAGIVGSKMFFFHTPNRLQGVGGRFNKFSGTGSHIGENDIDSGQYDLTRIDYPIGASIFTSKTFIETVGLMNEEYFLYYEEIDWAVRALQNGYSISFCPSSKIYHKEGATTGVDHLKKFKSEKSDLYSLRNRILFTRKYHKQFLPFVYLGFTIVVINRIRRGQIKRLVKIFKFLLTNEMD